MAPPDGTRVPRIPTLSWDSVVDSDDRATPAAPLEAAPIAEPGASIAPLEPPTPIEPVTPLEPVTPIEPVGLLPLSLDLAEVAETPSPPPAPVPSDPVSNAAVPPVPVPSAPTTPAPEPVAADVDATASAPVDSEPAVVRTAPPTEIVPVMGDVPAGPESLAPAHDDGALPPIREATPAPEPGGPMLPSAAPAVQRPPTASNFEFDPASVAVAPTRQPARRKRGGGLKLVATLIVLGGLVAAGLVFGQPYLFPSDWDDATVPYADAVESSSGAEFVEPLAITALPSAEFATRLTSELAPTSPQEVAEWRALGVATGVVDDATLTDQLTGWRDVVYVTGDGQVYHDAGAAGPGVDAQLVQAMAAALLDQQYSWSADQSQRSLDEAAATSAEVLRQTREVQRGSDFAAATEPVPTAQLDGLPAIVGYQLLAPHVLAEFPTEDDPNPLAALESGTSAPDGDAAPVPPSLPVMADGDVMTESPVSQDRSFWFLVFGGLLDAPTAFAASEAIVENSVVHATRGPADCVYATFSGGGVDETATLRSALTAWTEQAPAEFASTVTALPDGSLQLSSCDPGPAFSAPLRTTVVQELIAYRVLELATAEAVAEQGGGDPEFAYVWSLITGSTMPNDVAALSSGSPPGQIATSARDAVAALYDLAG